MTIPYADQTPEPPQVRTHHPQMVPNGPPEKPLRTLLQRFLDPGPDPAKLAALDNNPEFIALIERIKARQRKRAGHSEVTPAPPIPSDPVREAEQVRAFQSQLFQALDETFGPKSDPDAIGGFYDGFDCLLRANDRLFVLRLALEKYPAQVESFFPLVHKTLHQSQTGDAEEFLRHVSCLNFPDPIWRARCDLQLGLICGLKRDFPEALQLLDRSLPVLRAADPTLENYLFILTGETNQDSRHESWKTACGEEILVADLMIAKASMAAGNYERAVKLLGGIVGDAGFSSQGRPEGTDMRDLLRTVLKDLEITCKNLGGKLEEPVAFNETLPPDHHGKLLSDIYYNLYLCYSACSAEDVVQDATKARIRHELFWSGLGQTSPFLGAGEGESHSAF